MANINTADSNAEHAKLRLGAETQNHPQFNAGHPPQKREFVAIIKAGKLTKSESRGWKNVPQIS
eukprot:11222409-Lingulodinium_polyedra.AAC.1